MISTEKDSIIIFNTELIREIVALRNQINMKQLLIRRKMMVIGILFFEMKLQKNLVIKVKENN